MIQTLSLPVSRPSDAQASVRVSASASRALGARQRRLSPASAGPLEHIVKSRDALEAKQGFRLAKMASKRTSSELLRPHDSKLGARVSQCCYVAYSDRVELQRVTRPDGSVSGAVTGTVSCHSVWSCPVCSERISMVRRDELNHLLGWSRASAHSVVMLTLTARHNAGTKLAGFLEDLKNANSRFRQSRAWRALQAVGTVTATEVTHGRNGFHPHFHIIVVLKRSIGDPIAAVEGLRSQWLHQLARVGREGNEAAFHVQDASAIGAYVAKFGAGEELALGHVKQGRNGSRTPWQILSDARDGCAKSGRLWVEYSLAFKGRRQLSWSRGLKALCGLTDVSDEDCEEPEAIRETMRVWSGNSDGWRSARRRLCALLSAVENGSCLDKAEFGETDKRRWLFEVDDGQVLE